jgi:uncharacterized protein YbbC (DUF1343 family)
MRDALFLIKSWSMVICVIGHVPVYGVHKPFSLGVERFFPHALTNHGIKNPQSCRIGLIANQTSKDQKKRRTVDILRQRGFCVACIFAPEHGFDGKVPAGMIIENSVDEKTGIPVISLYGTGAGKKISPEVMDKIDVLVFDMQDCGMRHYTYISTLMTVLEAAALHKKTIFVLDRPNPLGAMVDGPLVEPELHSFISIAPIPLRHGMTIGEVARYFNEYIVKNKASLVVIGMEGYSVMQSYEHAIVLPLSPNIPSLHSLYGYSFLGLVGEIEPLDVGVGTTRPFQYLGLSDAISLSEDDWWELQKQLRALHIGTMRCAYKNPRKNKTYHGLRIIIKNPSKVPSWTTFLTIISFFKNKGVALAFSSAFAKAAGTGAIGRYFYDDEQQNGAMMSALQEKIKRESSDFLQKKQAVMLYK